MSTSATFFPEMTAVDKILWHEERVTDFLAGRPVFPVTLEMGLTTRCNRSCPDCPSSGGRAGIDLSLPLAERLLSLLEGETRGLILTGGEPTLHPDFGTILHTARKRGFIDRVVISNGSILDQEEISRPLLEAASAVRISLHGWTDRSLSVLEPTLKRIENLRDRIERSGSGLQIGVAVLTGNAAPETIGRLIDRSRKYGAHWLYLHPFCLRTPAGKARKSQPESWSERLREWQKNTPGFPIYSIPERFSGDPVEFAGYRAAHFILVAAADGKTYLSSETKFDPRYELDDIAACRDIDFLWERERLDRIGAVRSASYPAGGGRHRGVLYSALLDTLRRHPEAGRRPGHDTYLYPHII